MSKVKPTKLSGKNLMLSALKAIEEETGFHIIDIEFGNTYFFFEGKKDSICHFHIKEVPRFKFAFWNTNRFDTIQYELDNGLQLWSDHYRVDSCSELIFFTQFERDIDKFKPSYSSFVQGIFRQVWKDKSEETGKPIKKEEWYLSSIPEILRYMNKHPMKAYVYSSGYRMGIWDEISDFKVFKEYIRSNYYHYLYTFKKWLKVKHKLSVTKKFAKKLKTMDYIIFKKDSCYPEVEIKMTTRKDINKEDYDKDVNIIEKFENKYTGISVETWFVHNETNEPLSKDEIKVDKDLHKRFYGFIKTVNNILEGNSKETLEDWWIEKIICKNIKEDLNNG